MACDTADRKSLHLTGSTIWNSTYKQHKTPDMDAKVVITYSMDTICRPNLEDDRFASGNVLLQRVLASVKAVEQSGAAGDSIGEVEVVTAQVEFMNHYSAGFIIDQDNIDQVVCDCAEYIKGVSETLARQYITRLLSDTMLSALPIPHGAFKSSPEQSTGRVKTE